MQPCSRCFAWELVRKDCINGIIDDRWQVGTRDYCRGDCRRSGDTASACASGDSTVRVLDLAAAAAEVGGANSTDISEWMVDSCVFGELARAMDQNQRTVRGTGGAVPASSGRHETADRCRHLRRIQTHRRHPRRTQRLQQELEVLRKSQARYPPSSARPPMDSSSPPSTTSAVLEFNPAFRRMLGYTKDETRALFGLRNLLNKPNALRWTASSRH